jgi:hypothetical protein
MNTTRNGFSLAQVMVSLAILGIGSGVLASMLNGFFKYSAQADSKSGLFSILSELDALKARPSAAALDVLRSRSSRIDDCLQRGSNREDVVCAASEKEQLIPRFPNLEQQTAGFPSVVAVGLATIAGEPLAGVRKENGFPSTEYDPVCYGRRGDRLQATAPNAQKFYCVYGFMARLDACEFKCPAGNTRLLAMIYRGPGMPTDQPFASRWYALNYTDYDIQRTPSSAGAVTSRCPVGQVMKGVNPDGSAFCEPISAMILCPAGHVMRGIDAVGQPVCQALNLNCPAGMSLSGFDPFANPVCKRTSALVATRVVDGGGFNGLLATDQRDLVVDLQPHTAPHGWNVNFSYSLTNRGLCDTLKSQFWYWTVKKVNGALQTAEFFEAPNVGINRYNTEGWVGSARGGTNDWAGETAVSQVTLTLDTSVALVGATIRPVSCDTLPINSVERANQFRDQANPVVTISAYPL